MSRRVGIDFTGVESFKKASEGEHGCKIASAELKQSSGGNDMIVVAFEVVRGEDKGARVYENYPLTDTALWKLKGMLEAVGMKCDGKVSLDLDRLVGKSVNIVVKHEEYEGKIRARVDEVKKAALATTASSDDDDEVEEVEEEAPKKTKKSSKKEKEEVMHPPVNDDDDDDWDEEEDEEEEEEAPAPKKKAAKAVKPKTTEKKSSKKPAKVEEEDEDDDWDDDDWDE